MTFPEVPASATTIPCSEFPEMTFRWAGRGPPMWFDFELLKIATPDQAFGTAAVPDAFSPMKFPHTPLLIVLGPSMVNPSFPFPDRTLPDPGLFPPIMLAEAPLY